MSTKTAHPAPTRPSSPASGGLSELTDLDASGIPCIGEPIWRDRLADIALPGLPSGTLLAKVQRVQPPRPDRPLAWGTTNCRTIVFTVDERMASELQESLDAGEEPTIIVEPGQILAVDIDVVR